MTKGYIAPRPLTVIEQLKALGHKPGVSVKRGSDGARYMFIVTSNSYRDREREYITTKALRRYVEKSWIANDVCDTGNTHLLWHDGDPIGDIVWTDMQGPFLIEVAKERSNALIHLSEEHKAYISDVWDYIETHPEEQWGASHGFQYEEKRINPARDEAIYDEIKKFETSTLPLKNAANAYTFSGVIMNKDRNGLLDRIVGVDGAAEELRKGVQGIEKKLEAQGVEHKALDAAPADSAVKGLIDNIRAATEAYVGKLVDAPPPGLTDSVVQIVVAALAQATDPEDAADGGADEATEPVATTVMSLKKDIARTDMTKGQVKLLDTLIESQQDLVQSVEAIEKKLKEQEPLSTLAGVIQTLNSKLDRLSEDVRNVKAQAAGRPRAASQDKETEIEDKKMVEKATAQLTTFDPFWGAPMRPKE